MFEVEKIYIMRRIFFLIFLTLIQFEALSETVSGSCMKMSLVRSRKIPGSRTNSASSQTAASHEATAAEGTSASTRRNGEAQRGVRRPLPALSQYL